MSVSLRDKFFGCIAGAHIGSSMGAVVEGWLYPQIEEKFGTFDKLLPYEHYNNGWQREPGTTEDGIERQKLMITAIIEKQDRVTAEDVRAAWVKHIKPISIGMVSEPFEAELLKMAQTKMPATDIGRYCDYAGLNSFARACHPIGLINAGDPQGAKENVFEVGQLYQSAQSRGLQWACVTAVAIAAATTPEATVDSVLGTIYDYCHPDLVVKELDRELKKSANCKDFRDLRKYFDNVYSGQGMTYAFAFANEVVTKAVCIFRMVGGDVYKAMISGVNLGRDTDCITAVAAGISGALSGAGSIPQDLIDQVDAAAKANVYTNTQRTLREHADGLYGAYCARLNRMKALADEMGV